MLATKETAVIAAVSLLVATRRRPNWRHFLAAFGITLAVIALLLGPRETLQAIGAYSQRAVNPERHLHAWHYYLHLLLRSEAVIVLLAVLGAVTSKRSFVRFVAIYTLCMTIVYSLIPYKTPWCVLGFLYGMILLAGMGLIFLARTKPFALILVAIGAIQFFVVDAESVYSYADTSRDVYAIRDRIKAFRDLPIQVISPQNLWPLPWYLRDHPNVEWRRGVANDMQPASIILATPDMEPALLHVLYEVRPPGQRPLYIDLFSKHTELRSGVEIRGYVQQSVAAGF
jgi:predicted membrane-bound mannosyltransferase